MYNSGIYTFTNLISNKVYVGSTKDLDGRRRTHIQRLNAGTHANKYLQEDWSKGDSFHFEIQELCSEDELKVYEQKYINKFKPYELYNLYPADFESWNEHHSINVSGKNNYKYNDLKDGSVRNNEHDGNIDKKYGGTKNPRAKLTLDDCKKIKVELMKGLSVHLVAEKFNISSSTIKDIRRGNHWSNKELGGNLVDWLEQKELDEDAN